MYSYIMYIAHAPTSVQTSLEQCFKIMESFTRILTFYYKLLDKLLHRIVSGLILV